MLVGVLVGKTNEPEISRQVGENGGGGGIRTHGARKGTTVFETAPFDHSGTSPADGGGFICCLLCIYKSRYVYIKAAAKAGGE